MARTDRLAASENHRPGDEFVPIDDKVFPQEGRFAHMWDLANGWRGQTT
jgi:hypothetical protein